MLEKTGVDVDEMDVEWSSLKILVYRQISNISRTKSQNLNVSRLVLQLPLPNPVKPGVKSRMKM